MTKHIRKLKDKVWTRSKIKIEAIVEQTKEGNGTTNKTVGWIVSIDNGYCITSFRENNKLKLWKRIKDEVYL